jgi:hypothetical protein
MFGIAPRLGAALCGSIITAALGLGTGGQTASAARSTYQLRYHLTLVPSDSSRWYAWEGRVDGPRKGRMNAELQFRGAGRVRAHWLVKVAPASASFEANLDGTIDGRSGTIHLAGPIIAGAWRGRIVRSDGRLGDGGSDRTVPDWDGAMAISLSTRTVWVSASVGDAQATTPLGRY